MLLGLTRFLSFNIGISFLRKMEDLLIRIFLIIFVEYACSKVNSHNDVENQQTAAAIHKRCSYFFYNTWAVLLPPIYRVVYLKTCILFFPSSIMYKKKCEWTRFDPFIYPLTTKEMFVFITFTPTYKILWWLFPTILHVEYITALLQFLLTI